MNAEWTVSTDDAGTRLDKFLAAAERLGSRGKAVTALERGKVLLNGADVAPDEGARRLVAGDVVRFWADRPGSSKRRLEPMTIRMADGRRADAGRAAAGRAGAGRGGVAAGGAPAEAALHVLHEDDGIIVVNKPAGLLTVPLERKGDPSVLEMLEAHLRSHGKHRQPLAVHRIDRDTSGLVLFAKQPRAHDVLKEQFVQHEPERVYAAVVYGLVSPSRGTWQDYLVWDQRTLAQRAARPEDPRAVEAICEYRVLEAFPSGLLVDARGGAAVALASLLDVKLHTGKRNQIRIQAALRAHRLIGEKLYARGIDPRGEIPFPRQALHARLLSFQHPLTDRPMTFEAPLPADMQELIARLRRG